MTPMLLSNRWPDDHPAVKAAMPTDEIADIVVRGIDDERFLILARPHRIEELQAKGRDYEQWINDAAADGHESRRLEHVVVSPGTKTADGTVAEVGMTSSRPTASDNTARSPCRT